MRQELGPGGLGLLFELASALFGMAEFVMLRAQRLGQRRQCFRFDPVLATDGTDRVETVFDPVPPCRIHVDGLAIAPQQVGRLAELDARILQQFERGLEIRIEFDELLQRTQCFGDEAVGVAVVAVVETVQCRADAFGKAPAVGESLSLAL